MTKKVQFTESFGLTEVGELVWWTVRKPGVGEKEIKGIVNNYEVPKSLKQHIPNSIRPRDAYRRATNFDVMGEIDIYGDRLNFKLFAREVNSDLKHIMRKLVFELIDKDEETLEHIVIANLLYIEDSDEKFKIEILREEFAEDEDIQSVLEKMKKDFTYNMNIYPGNTIRAFIRDMVKELNGYQAIPRGGLYFIPASKKKELDIIDKIVHDIDNKSLSTYETQNVLNRQRVLGDQGVETARNIYKTHINNTLIKWEKKLRKAENKEDLKEKLNSILQQSDLLTDQIKLLEDEIGFNINHSFIEKFKEEMIELVEDKIKGTEKNVSRIFSTLKNKLKTA